MLQNQVELVKEWTNEARKYLHSIPEVAFEEVKTAKFIAEKLTEIGYQPETGIAKTGVIAVLDTKREGPTIMLRADMDALNMEEDTGVSFSSTHSGKAHACGHDTHVAMLLGAAKVLFKLQDRLLGKVLFVFQPAEEGLAGAKRMISEGLFERHPVDFAFGMHAWPALPLGTFGIKSGNLMAAMNRFEIEIIGKGGHGAMPHQCVDALEIGTQVVAGLQRLNSRKINPLEPSVVTVGSFHSGTAFNIIPGSATLIGTTRTYNRDIWKNWGKEIEQVVSGICSSMGADYRFEIDEGYPPLINDDEAAAMAYSAALKITGKEFLVEPEPSMGGEDMSFYHEKVPGCFVFLGCGGEGVAALHNPKFVVPEAALANGVALHCQLIVDILGQ